MSSLAKDRKAPVAKEPTTIGSREVRNQVGDLIARACWGKERFIITRNGKPIAAIIGMDDYDALDALDTEDADAVQVPA